MPRVDEATNVIELAVEGAILPRCAARRPASPTSVTATTISARAAQTEISDRGSRSGNATPSLSSLPVANARGKRTHPNTAHDPATREPSHQANALPNSKIGAQNKSQRSTRPNTMPEASSATSIPRLIAIAATPASMLDTADGRTQRVAQDDASATVPTIPSRAAPAQ